MLQGSADARYPQLLPRITLADGSVLMPLAFFEGRAGDAAGATTDVTLAAGRDRSDGRQRRGRRSPADDRDALHLRARRITREDRIAAEARACADRARIGSPASPRSRAAVAGRRSRFGSGEVTAFRQRPATARARSAPADARNYARHHRADCGPLVRCKRAAGVAAGRSPLGWNCLTTVDMRDCRVGLHLTDTGSSRGEVRASVVGRDRHVRD